MKKAAKSFAVHSPLDKSNNKTPGLPDIKSPQLFSDKWNKSYAGRLAKKGPGGIKSGNLGTSYLVAPMYT